jgi:ribosome biogenesis GTPase
MQVEESRHGGNVAVADQPPGRILAGLGWDAAWQTALTATPEPSAIPGRVSRIDRGELTVLTEAGARRVRIGAGVAVAVGDWITIEAGAESGDRCRLVAVLCRRSVLSRAVAGRTLDQLMAANVDSVLVVVALNRLLSAGQLDRYLALARRSGAVHAVVITKVDLVAQDQVHRTVATIRAASPGVAVHSVSTVTGDGLGALDRYLAPGRTAVLLGLSGAGKSSLVNALAGTDVATGEARADGQGRHTTTHRELVSVRSGGVIIDTPGMRTLEAADPDAPGLPPPTDHEADRQQVTDRKRRKSIAKIARRTLRAQTIHRDDRKDKKDTP